MRALLHEDSAHAVEQVSHTIGAVLEDGASAAEAIQDARTSRVTTEDAVRVSEDAVYRVLESVADTATAGDAALGRLSGFSLTTDAATIAETVEDDRSAAAMLAIDGARGASLVSDRLHAAHLVADLALADALMVGEVGIGQAWTAGVDGWAMTRYAPYAFQQLAVGWAAEPAEVQKFVNARVEVGELMTSYFQGWDRYGEGQRPSPERMEEMSAEIMPSSSRSWPNTISRLKPIANEAKTYSPMRPPSKGILLSTRM